MHRGMISGILGALAAAFIFFCQKGPDQEQLISASRKVTDSYMGELKMALSSAISQSGVVGAVDVCSELAPEVARKYSSADGWEVRRVSRKFRNAHNAPDSFESQGLEILSAKAQGDDEYYTWDIQDGQRAFRYLRTIRMAVLCVNCHGDAAAFSPELRQVLSTKYPNDNATGFEVGDFRGAFSIKINWPQGKAGVDSINHSL
ncbi:MAG: hypothetical protein A2W25_14595 [candidate division Zixibacteria bacterium RBG_16_53_22]|nr:MAG: hypothetical protein A2W25_14595 [candidate division Zixibacteria bacterium RBG_16_53_22]